MKETGHDFYRARGKRLVDVALVLPGLLSLLPFLGLLALGLRVFQGRPIIFRQTRIGRNGQPFALFKFRTMVEGAEWSGTVTAGSDPRITPIGRVLRRLKLDELPQLLNVLRGDMALVGPRPEVAEYVARLGPDAKAVLSVRPGITGLSTVRFRDEEELLARASDAIALNDRYIYPLKTRLNLWYIDNLSFGLDLRCLAATAFPSLLADTLMSVEGGQSFSE